VQYEDRIPFRPLSWINELFKENKIGSPFCKWQRKNKAGKKKIPWIAKPA